MALHIVFDTSVLRPSTHQLLDSPEIEAIKRLAAARRIQIHFPYIVENEFKTQRKSHYLNLISDISKDIEKLYDDEKGKNGDFFKKLSQIRTDIQNNKQNIAEEKTSYIDEWINETNSVRRSIEPNDAIEVFDRYFSGKLPFSGIKSRKDIPDAFILQSIININADISNDDKLIAIINDELLRKACQELEVECFKNLDELTRSNIYSSMYKNHCIENNLTNIQEGFFKYIDKNDPDKLLSDYLSRKDVVDDIARQIKIAYKQLAGILVKDLFVQNISLAKNANYISDDIFTIFFNSKVVLSYLLETDTDDSSTSQKFDTINISGRIKIFADLEKITSNCDKETFNLDITKEIEVDDLSIDSLEEVDKKIKEQESKNKTIQVERIENDFRTNENYNNNYYVLNTNARNNINDHTRMLDEKIAAAFYHPWKLYIEQLNKGDVVFLYQSGVGIVACGKASSILKKREYDGIEDNEYYIPLEDFCKLKHPMSAYEMKIVANRNFNFMRTMFGIDSQSGELILKVSKENCI